uniref:Uncharacterized protein n=1 Tax=Palpitomonas bilix TaxID=652834 RepID=A0A7S3CWE5_9EUKA
MRTCEREVEKGGETPGMRGKKERKTHTHTQTAGVKNKQTYTREHTYIERRVNNCLPASILRTPYHAIPYTPSPPHPLSPFLLFSYLPASAISRSTLPSLYFHLIFSLPSITSTSSTALLLRLLLIHQHLLHCHRKIGKVGVGRFAT